MKAKNIKNLFKMVLPAMALSLVLVFAPVNIAHAEETSSTDGTVLTTSTSSDGTVATSTDGTTTTSDSEATASTDATTTSDTSSEQVVTSDSTTTDTVATADFDSMGVFLIIVAVGLGAIGTVTISEVAASKH